MSTAQKVVVALAAIVAGLVLYAELTRHGAVQPVKLDAHLGVDVDADLARPWTCQPSDMHPRRRFPFGFEIGGPAMRRPHHLYRRPVHSRPAHRKLAAEGWQSWVVDPPSEREFQS